MKICVVGGAGYVGSVLIPSLLSMGHTVTVLDTFWYGDHLLPHPSLRKIKGDIRQILDLEEAYRKQDAVIHLACVSNDPSFDMNPKLGKEINLDSFPLTLEALNECKVKRFIYASTSSVYGVSDLDEVTESADKNPLTDYSKYKLACEEMLRKSDYKGMWTIIRPATVCGYARRLRLDLVVNILTINALVNKKIILFGHDQKRPNIHVNDMVRAYLTVLDSTEIAAGQTFNVGFENKSLWEIATLVKEVVGQDVEIVEKPTNDPRSYHINSDKINGMLGFETIFSIKDAILSIYDAYNEGLLKDPLNNPDYYNIKKMKGLDLV